jgi:hypothetical protein
MQKNNNNNEKGRHENPLPNEIKNEERIAAEKAHEMAEKDIEKDPDLSIHSPNDDLDEGETARLGEGKNDLI